MKVPENNIPIDGAVKGGGRGEGGEWEEGPRAGSGQ
jgi:hypothetical protein